MPAVLRVAVPVPLPQLFDYLPPRGSRAADIAPGSRVAVPFGRGKRVGIVIDNAAESEIDASRLKPAFALLDAEPVIDAELLATLQWVSKYYLHPLGEVLDTALPVGLAPHPGAAGAGRCRAHPYHDRRREAARGFDERAADRRAARRRENVSRTRRRAARLAQRRGEPAQARAGRIDPH